MSNQLYQMAIDIAANLRARKYPVQVQYGPDRVDHEGHDYMLLHFQHDTQLGDTLSAVQGTRGVPSVRVKNQGAVLDIRVQAGLEGCRHCEHEELCDTVVDGVLTALDSWAVEARAGMLDFVELGYVSPEDYDGSERRAGVVYRIRFRLPRAILEKDFDGSMQPTATIARVTTSDRVSIDGTNWENV